jgi:predicted secreted protein
MSGPSVKVSRLLAAAALALGVGLPLVEGAMSNDDATLLITDKDDGKTLVASVGKALTLKLPCQLGTGYAWAIAGTHKLLEVAGEPKLEGGESGTAGGARVGGAAQQVFRFRVQGVGTTTLQLELVRSWEKGAKPQKTFRVTLEIR